MSLAEMGLVDIGLANAGMKKHILGNGDRNIYFAGQQLEKSIIAPRSIL
jgi:hypothetical protein